MKRIGMRLAALAAAVVIASGSMAVPSGMNTGTVTACAKTRLQFSGNSENDDWEFNRQDENNHYFLPDADTYYITEKNISWMDDDELVLARNEFFARRGRKFSTKWIQEYFDKQEWYHGKIEEKRFTSSLFNAYEIANVNFILSYESRLKAKRKKKVTKLRISGPNEAPDEYGELMTGYTEAALSGWGADEVRALGLKWYSVDKDAVKSLGYACLDLDGDGRDEFLVGSSDKKEYGDGAVFALYTIQDGKARQLLMSDGYVEYFLCEDGYIRREETSDDGRWNTSYFRLEGGRLVCTSVTVMDESANEKKPWYTIKAEEKLQGFKAEEGKTAGQAGSQAAAAAKEGELTGTESFELEEIPEDQIGSIGIESMKNVSDEEAAAVRTSHTGEELELVPFLVD